MNREQLENYLIDCLGYSQSDCNDYKVKEMQSIIDTLGENSECLEYNGLL